MWASASFANNVAHQGTVSVVPGQHQTSSARIEIDQQWVSRMSARLTDLVPVTRDRMALLQSVHEAARSHDLHPSLVLAVITVESRFNPRAVSKSGALGLMQVMPFWIKEIGHPSHDLTDINTNLAYGCSILKRYLNQTNNNLPQALASYNGGGDPQYASKVLTALRWRFGDSGN